MRRPQPLWFGLLALAGAAVLNLDVDDATLALEATDATDIDAYVASLSLPRLEGAGCAANDAPCVQKVVADALRAAVEDEAPPACLAPGDVLVRMRLAPLALLALFRAPVAPSLTLAARLASIPTSCLYGRWCPSTICST